MKPPVRGNGFVMYPVFESENRKWNALKDFIEKLPFLAVFEPESCKALMVYRSTSLMDLKRSQATSLDSKTVSANKNSVHKKEVYIMNRKMFFVGLAMVLLATAFYFIGHHYGAKTCGEVKALNITPANTLKVTPTPTSTRKVTPPAPVRETRTEESYNQLVFVNQTGTDAEVVYVDNNTNKVISKMVGSKGYGLRVHSDYTNLMVNGKRKEFRFKSSKGGRIVYMIKG